MQEPLSPGSDCPVDLVVEYDQSYQRDDSAHQEHYDHCYLEDERKDRKEESCSSSRDHDELPEMERLQPAKKAENC